FKRVLGFDLPPDWRRPKRHLEAVNPSLSRDYLEFLKAFDRGEFNRMGTLARERILEAAFEEAGPRPVVEEWISPRHRSLILKARAKGNAGIRARFLRGREGAFLFPAPAPSGWKPYPGLTGKRREGIAARARALT